jgi:hypothetical protein
MCIFTKKVFYCFYFPTSLTVVIESHPGFECFVVCPLCSVEDLKCCFSRFISKGCKMKLFICIVESAWSRAYTNVFSLSCLICGGHSGSSIVLDLVSQVRDVILMNVYLDLETQGGWDFGMRGI